MVATVMTTAAAWAEWAASKPTHPSATIAESKSNKAGWETIRLFWISPMFSVFFVSFNF